ncbi:MAG: TonB-dependent receptor [Sphingobium sp.]
MATTALAMAAQPAWADDAADDADADQATIVVTGYRASLQQARDAKRNATIIQDSIVAEDIAAFPDLNLAEALQRLPGIAINREAGEGRRVSLRGLGPDFTRVQLNGMEVLGNVDSPQDSRGQTTRDRAFDFNIFASELFSRVDVQKSYAAELSEGGLAGTVSLTTARPFDYKGFRSAFSVQSGTNSLTKDFQPRVAALVSQNWGDFGILISGAYNKRKTQEQGFDTYRWRPNNATGSIISSLSAADQAAINSGTLLFPRGNRYSVWESEQERLGLTGSIQWRPSPKVNLTLDALYGQFKADRFETHLASRGGGGSTLLGGGGTFAGVTYPNSTINAIHYNADNEVDYLDVSGANMSTETRTQKTKNIFKQIVLSGDAEIAAGLKVTAAGGIERSKYSMPVSDKFYLETYGRVISDYRGGTYSLVNSYGFNPGDISLWHAREIDMSATYQNSALDNAKLKFDYEVSSGNRIAIGGEWRRFKNSGYTQTVDDLLLPQFRAGTVSSDISGYGEVYTGFRGIDWAIVDYDKALRQLGVTRDLGARKSVYDVTERTGAGYVQYNWNHALGTTTFRGNIGARYYRTDVTSNGEANVGYITVKGDYDGVLPAANFAFEFDNGFVLRGSAAQNINRPSLSALAVNGTVTDSGGDLKVTVGNPSLKPYKSIDLDLSAEYYFGKAGYLAAGLFYKNIDGFIATQTVSNVRFGDTGLPTSIMAGLTNDSIVNAFTRPVNLQQTDLYGLELAMQTDFTFLPAPFDHFGTVLNFTYANAKLDYAKLAAGATRTTLEGLSKITANATLYYQDERFNARISGNYRAPYVYSGLPITSTLAGVTVFDQDSSGYDDTLYVDFSAQYKIAKNFEVTFDAINLTNQREKQYSDSSRRLYVVTYSGTTVMGGVRVTF